MKWILYILLMQPLVAPKVEIPPSPEVVSVIPDSPPQPIPRKIIAPSKKIVWRDEYIAKYRRHVLEETISPLVIVYDDERNSRLMLKELTWSWSEEDSSLKKYDLIQQELPVRELTLIHYLDFDKLKKNKVDMSKTNTFPCYRFSVAGDMKVFPNKTFSAITWPLLTVQALSYKNSNLVDVWMEKATSLGAIHEKCLEEYNQQFIMLNNISIRDYVFRLCTTCREEIYECECYSQEWGSWRRTYKQDELSKLERYYPPIVIYPKKPVVEMPWENIDE